MTGEQHTRERDKKKGKQIRDSRTGDSSRSVSSDLSQGEPANPEAAEESFVLLAGAVFTVHWQNSRK